jgi:hypothetical protein
MENIENLKPFKPGNVFLVLNKDFKNNKLD